MIDIKEARHQIVHCGPTAQHTMAKLCNELEEERALSDRLKDEATSAYQRRIRAEEDLEGVCQLCIKMDNYWSKECDGRSNPFKELVDKYRKALADG
jgi:hypothetical protein